MANAIYPEYKKSLLSAENTNLDLDQTTANIAPYAILIDTGVYSIGAPPSTHKFKNPSITGQVLGSEGANGKQITTPTLTNVAGGTTFDGADVIFTAVTGATVEAFVIYRQNAGADTTWHLVMYYDTAGGGLPVTPNGGDITIQWNASGIFTL